MTWLEDGWNGAKKIGKGAVRVMSADTIGADKGDDIWTKFDKKFISGDFDEKKRREGEAKTIANQRERDFDAGYEKLNQANDVFDINEGSRINTYKKGRDGIVTGMNSDNRLFERDQETLRDEAKAQAADATNVYKDLSTRSDKIMNDADKEAGSAMTLAQYQDPNNAVATSTRKLYEDQAQGEMRRGQADYGVMSALGAQNAGQYAGAGPMTAGQQMAYLAQSQRQAGDAYANAQRRVGNLRDQGLQMGFDRTDRAYAAGQGAKDRQRQSVGDRQTLEANKFNLLGGYRGEQSGYGQNILGSQQQRGNRNLGVNQENYSMDTGFARDKMGRGNSLTTLKMGRGDQKAAAEFQRLDREQAADDRDVARNQGWLNTGINVGGKVVGGMMGNPGAADGVQVPQGQQVTAMNYAPAAPMYDDGGMPKRRGVSAGMMTA